MIINWGCRSGAGPPFPKKVSSPFPVTLPITYSNAPAAPLAGVNIGGAGSYVYDAPANNNQSCSAVDSAAKSEEKRVFAPKPPSKGGSRKTTSVEKKKKKGKKKHTVVAIFFFSEAGGL